MYLNGKIYNIIKRSCPRCGFSHNVAREVGKTSLKGSDAGFVRPVRSPFYFGASRGAEVAYIPNSAGGGAYWDVAYSILTYFPNEKVWRAIGRRSLNSSSGAPFFKGLIPHSVQYYEQDGGDKGYFEAHEVEPLEPNHKRKDLCTACKAEVERIRDRRTKERSLTIDQKMGFRTLSLVKEKNLVTTRFGDCINLWLWTKFSDYKKSEDLKDLCAHRFLTIAGVRFCKIITKEDEFILVPNWRD